MISTADSSDLPREARLRTPADFRRVQAKGRTYDLGPLVLRLFRPSFEEAWKGPSTARLGLAVSRRAGNAVQRNRIKRRVREWFRRHRGSLNGFDVVVMARPAAATLDQRAVESLFSELLRRLERS